MINLVKETVALLWWGLYAVGLIAAIAVAMLFVKSVMGSVFKPTEKKYPVDPKKCTHPAKVWATGECPDWGYKCFDCGKRYKI